MENSAWTPFFPWIFLAEASQLIASHLAGINIVSGIFSLGSIPKCLNLCILDLSSNHVSSVGELAVLASLEHLDLSHNSVSQLGL